jgi:hypothetical protein
VGVVKSRAKVDEFSEAVFTESRLLTPHPTLPHKGGGKLSRQSEQLHGVAEINLLAFRVR